MCQFTPNDGLHFDYWSLISVENLEKSVELTIGDDFHEYLFVSDELKFLSNVLKSSLVPFPCDKALPNCLNECGFSIRNNLPCFLEDIDNCIPTTLFFEVMRHCKVESDICLYLYCGLLDFQESISAFLHSKMG
jgi:hypothetical protein